MTQPLGFSTNGRARARVVFAGNELVGDGIDEALLELADTGPA